MSRVLYLDSKTYLPGDILTKVDRMSMATSLEVRAPLVDHELMEWVTLLGPRWKMNGHSQKYILMKLAQRVGVPDEVLQRPKRGFELPLVHWMRTELKDLTATLLLDKATLQRGYFNGRGVQQLLNKFLLGGTNDYLELWRLMMFELWFRNYLSQLPSTNSARAPESFVLAKRFG